ncbi:hypothetical protein A2U01_0011119 [Trifolium medium]|uniref:Endonuclease/exonuclease/phosphatase domain-containing protein n=1 Tax=Trifolium medium TaxID=97028 RepID=A0A392MU50_9FABA|nr:hypothetical protein [Trifolium medium]
MRILSWNCQGIGNPRTVRAFKKLIANHHPDLIFLMETKLLDNQYHFLNSYKYTYSAHTINCSMTGGGGNTLEPNITSSFRNTISHCDLQDLGYQGSIYTWTNKHQGEHLIKSRLDRFLATIDWITMFPNYTNTHLMRYRSDHCPILLEFPNLHCNRSNTTHYHGRKFEQIWTTDKQHKSIVREAWLNKQGDIKDKLQHTLNNLHNWGRQTFGVIPKRIKDTQQELESLQLSSNSQNMSQQIAIKEKELDNLLEMEESGGVRDQELFGSLMETKIPNFFIKRQVNVEGRIELI